MSHNLLFYTCTCIHKYLLINDLKIKSWNKIEAHLNTVFMIYHPLSITIPTSSPIMKLVSILIEWISKPLPQYRGQQELKTVFIVKFM